MYMNCKEGVTYKTLLAMYLTFFTSMTISSFGFFTMIFFFEEDYHQTPQKALSTVSLLLFYGMPFNLISSVFSGYIFNKFGRKKPIFIGFFMTLTILVFIPFVGTIDGVLVLMIISQITSAWTQNPPLIADYIEPNSIGKAVAIQGLLNAVATIFAIGVMFDQTKHLPFQVQIPVFCALMYFLAAIAIIGI